VRISATRARRLAAPSKTTRHAFPVTFRRDACAPFRSDFGRPNVSAANPRARGARPSRPSLPIRCRDGLPSSASADTRVCDELVRRHRAALRQRDGVRTSMRSNRLLLPNCFDYEYPRLSRFQHLFEAYASPTLQGLRPWTGRLEDRAFHDAPIRFGGRFGFARGVFDHVPPNPPSLRHPCRFVERIRSLTRAGYPWRCQDHIGRCSVKSGLRCGPRCLPSPAWPRLPRGGPISSAVT